MENPDDLRCPGPDDLSFGSVIQYGEKRCLEIKAFASAKLEGTVHIVKDFCGGEYGFYSAHASNTFATAVFLTILFQRRYRYLYFVLIGWAALMSYTRIYLGIHYPSDTIAGALAGCLIGWFTGRITIYLLALQGNASIIT